jgi:hypothetical protein
MRIMNSVDCWRGKRRVGIKEVSQIGLFLVTRIILYDFRKNVKNKIVFGIFFYHQK